MHGGYMKIYFLSILLFLLIPGCDLLTDSSDSSSPLHKSTVIDGIEYSADIPTDIFSVLDTLRISFNVTNHTLSPKEFNFGNMQQLCFQLKDKYGRAAISYPFIVQPATSRFSLAPGETRELTLRSPFKDHTGRYIDRGYYTLNVSLADGNSPKIDLTILIQ